MSVKTVNARLKQKEDTEANWNLAVNFVPLAGEIIVYTMSDSTKKMKIGDGTTTVVNLPFVGDENVVKVYRYI